MRRSLGIALATLLFCAGCSSTQDQHEQSLADPADYRIDAMDDFCFEPDVFNTSGEVKHFAFQLQLGSEYSEVQFKELQPGALAHLHIFDSYWTPGPEQDRLIALAGREPCTLLVFDEGR